MNKKLDLLFGLLFLAFLLALGGLLAYALAVMFGGVGC